MMRFVLLTALLIAAACTGHGSETVTDAGIDLATCSIPQQPPPGVRNDPRCPSQYGGGATRPLCIGTPPPCSVDGLRCNYYGVGDGTPGCQAIAAMFCTRDFSADGGGATWRCAN